MFVRFGEWDSGKNSEPLGTVEIKVAEVTIHPNFNSGNLKYNIAVILLASKVPLGANPAVTNICLSSKITLQLVGHLITS
jgi:Trypsin